MVENPTPGLSVVPGDVPVTVTREEHHQRALSRYTVAPGGERHIAAELVWCTIAAGKYKGQRGIEIRVDGHRVGELTHMMAQRYAPLLEHGGRVGCEATVTRNDRGLQVTLLLPSNANTAFLTPPPAEPPTERFAPVRPIPAAVAPARAAWKKPLWIGAAVVLAVFVLAGIFGGNDDDTSTANTAADQTTTTTTFEPPPTTTTTTTTTTPPPPPPTTTVVAPPVTEEPVVEAPPPAPAPPPVVVEPEPQSGCDPNYTGCVPIASDVDCEGGSGNGPAYASGPVQVIGSDIYKLDSDDDGTACE